MAGAAGQSSTGQPVRPYSSPDQLGGTTPRSAEFTTGTTGDPGSAASSLNADSARYNLLTPKQFEPTSILQAQASRPSMNAMSATDYERVLPGGYTLPTANGQSTSSYEASLPLRLSGLNAE
jgi:hypothetical protein